MAVEVEYSDEQPTSRPASQPPVAVYYVVIYALSHSFAHSAHLSGCFFPFLISARRITVCNLANRHWQIHIISSLAGERDVRKQLTENAKTTRTTSSSN